MKNPWYACISSNGASIPRNDPLPPHDGRDGRRASRARARIRTISIYGTVLYCKGVIVTFVARDAILKHAVIVWLLWKTF